MNDGVCRLANAVTLCSRVQNGRMLALPRPCEGIPHRQTARPGADSLEGDPGQDAISVLEFLG